MGADSASGGWIGVKSEWLKGEEREPLRTNAPSVASDRVRLRSTNGCAKKHLCCAWKLGWDGRGSDVATRAIHLSWCARHVSRCPQLSSNAFYSQAGADALAVLARNTSAPSGYPLTYASRG